MSPREAWLELARDIVQLFLSVNFFVGEVVSDLGNLKRKVAISRTENTVRMGEIGRQLVEGQIKCQLHINFYEVFETKLLQQQKKSLQRDLNPQSPLNWRCSTDRGTRRHIESKGVCDSGVLLGKIKIYKTSTR